MAKGNLFLGKARGSVGSVTFSQLNGKQISRAKATQVKNPKTDAQMIQRVIMNTTVQGYSGMQAIVDHSFQGVAYQGPSMNKFNSLNAKALRESYANFQSDSSVLVSFNGNGNKKISVNRWIISTGSLPRVEMKLEDGVVDTKQYESGGNLIDSGVILSMPGDGQAPTYQELIAYYGLQAGDQLTLCALVKRADENDVVGCDFKYGRFILMPSDGDLSHTITDATVANPKNENLIFALSDNDYALCFADFEALGTNGNNSIYAAGIITSRLENSAWKRSSTTMEFATDDLAGVGLTMQQAIASYSGQDIDTNSPYYLNQAKRTADSTEVAKAKGLFVYFSDSSVSPARYLLGFMPENSEVAKVVITEPISSGSAKLLKYSQETLPQDGANYAAVVNAGTSQSYQASVLIPETIELTAISEDTLFADDSQGNAILEP